MKLLFKQRMFSWFDSYDIYYEDGSVAYTVKGQLSWGHKLVIYDAQGRELGMVREVVLAMLPRFELAVHGQVIGQIRKEFSLLRPKFNIDMNSWHVEGNLLEWDYQVLTPTGAVAATVSKELLHWTDTYLIDVAVPSDALYCLMLVLAIDAEKCSR